MFEFRKTTKVAVQLLRSFTRNAFKHGPVFQKTKIKLKWIFSTVLYFHFHFSCSKSAPSQGCLLLVKFLGPALKYMKKES